MPLNQLHHFTILTDDIDRTSDFFVEALGLARGPTPDIGFPFQWIYCGDQPVVHVVGRDAPEAAGCGRVDHLAFNCSDYAGVKARIDAYGANQKEQTLDQVGVHQIFVESPEGVWLELIFPIEEYRQAQNAAG